MKTIQLANTELVALIDDEFEAVVSPHKWCLHTDKNVQYAHAWKVGSMHRLIATALGFPADLLVDHRNRNGLDNRRQNLRPATRAQNAWNCRRATGVSGHPGVQKNRNGWAVRFEHAGRRMYFGTHRDLETAKQIASREMAALRGEFLSAEVAALSARLQHLEKVA